MMRFKIPTMIVLGLSFCCSQFVHASDDGQQLAWRFRPNQQFLVTLVQEGKIESRMRGRIQLVDNIMVMKMNWRVDSVDASENARVEMAVQQMSLRLSTPREGGVELIEFDTAQPAQAAGAAREMLRAIDPLLDQPFYVIMTPRGRILNVDVPAETREAVQAAPDSMLIRNLLTADGLREVLGQAAVVFPAEPVEHGGAWTEERNFDNELGKFRQQLEFTYEGPVEREQQVRNQIRVSSQLTQVDQASATGSATDPATPGTGAGASSVTEYSYTGSMWFDEEMRYIAGSDVETSIVTETPYREAAIRTAIDTKLTLRIEPHADEGGRR